MEQQQRSRRKELALTQSAFFHVEYLGYSLYRHQTQWLDVLDRKPSYYLLLAPSDHGKSVCYSCTYPIHQLVKNRNLRIIIAAESDNLAQANLSLIKQHLEYNKKLIDTFGKFKTSKTGTWGKDAIYVDREAVLRDPSVYAVGCGTSFTGRRADIIIFDDIVSQKNSRTPEMRRKLEEWFYQTLLPCLEPDGAVLGIGTRWYTDDLYGKIIKDAKFKVVIQKAIIDENIQEVLCPEKWPYSKLVERREIDFVSYMKRYQNVIVDTDEVLISADSIDKCKDNSLVLIPALDESQRSKFSHVVTGIDLAASLNTRYAKYSSFFTVGVYDSTQVVLDIWKGRKPWPEVKKLIHEAFMRYKQDVIFVEGNAFQLAAVQELKQEGLPVRSIYTSNRKYEDMTGITYYSNLLYNRKLLLPYGDLKSKTIVDEFIQQLITYPNGDFSDIMMAWYILESGLAPLLKKRNEVVMARPNLIQMETGGKYGLQSFRNFDSLRTPKIILAVTKQ